MAGFLFSIDNEDSLIDSISKGVFSTKLSKPKESWKTHHEGTFADYCSMREGDNVYFFIKRKIYGIGTLVNINGDCKFLNYPDSNLPVNQNFEDLEELLLYNLGIPESLNHRFVCVFKPYPVFFKNGIDMDEVLSSSPTSFKILRAFWKLSFIKFTDDENQAFKNILLRRNVDAIDDLDSENRFQSNHEITHENIRIKTRKNQNYFISIAPFLNTITNVNGSLKHEMAIEAAIIYQLSINHFPTVNVFGNWDFLSHQVVASPFKPIDYMDKMDIFGYRYLQNQKPTIIKYLVVEIKKDNVESQDVIQLMKYVDWVKNEYTYGDYGMIKAFIVGHRFTESALMEFQTNVERRYIYGVRPSISAVWTDVKMVSYAFNSQTNLLDFNIVN
jgi:hypothetical protein